MGRRILIVDDDPGLQKTLGDRLRHCGFEVETASDGAKGLAAVNKSRPDVMLLDLHMPVMGGIEVLRRLREEGSDLTVIVITAFGSIESAVEAMRAGAYDFLTKPIEPSLVELTINRALERDGLRTHLEHLRETSKAQFPGVVASSPQMNKVLDTARRAAASDATVLLLGETGTGKEVLARAVHNWSPRNEKPFVAVNCAALPGELLESELFGHEKGAFTGAHKLRRGRFELASEGTLFLDEIAELNLSLQAKLLRVLDGRGFERVGGGITLQTTARIIAATNQNLEDAKQQGQFREDLYHRLNVVIIKIPPLRDRQEDIEDLVDFFIRKHCISTKQPPKEIASDAFDALKRYSWPGNVRELANAIESAVVLTTEPTIHTEDLPEHIIEFVGDGGVSRSEEKQGYRAAVAQYRRELIEDALCRANGNQTKAAEILGLQRTYLARLIRQFDVQTM